MATPRASVSRHGGDVALLVAAAIAAATSYSTIYTDLNITVIVVGCAVLAGLTALRLAPRLPLRVSLCLALLIGLVPQVWWPPSGNVELGRLFRLATGLGMLASVLLVAGALAAGRRWLLGVLALVTAAAAGILVIQSSGHPAIDVWVILQQSARAVLHGSNPYELHFSGVPAGQTDNCFNYLPFSFLGSIPGWALLGDVRYSELAFLLAGATMLAWALRRAEAGCALARGALAGGAPFGLLLVVMAVSMPGTLRVAQQSWNEGMILGCLLAAVALLLLGRAWLAVVPLALALATKQHVALILPLWALWPRFGWRRALAAGGLAAGICLPWLLANPGRFYGCTVRFFLDLPARQDSLSVWKFLPHPVRAAAVLALAAGAYLLAHRFLDRSAASLAFGCGLVFVAFDLANKQSFENQWLLACQLLVVGLACRAVERAGEDRLDGADLAPAQTNLPLRHEGADIP